MANLPPVNEIAPAATAASGVRWVSDATKSRRRLGRCPSRGTFAQSDTQRALRVKAASGVRWVSDAAKSRRRLGRSPSRGTFAESDTQRALRVKTERAGITCCCFKLIKNVNGAGGPPVNTLVKPFRLAHRPSPTPRPTQNWPSRAAWRSLRATAARPMPRPSLRPGANPGPRAPAHPSAAT